MRSILNCLGLCADESTARGKLLPFRLDRRLSGGPKKVKGRTVKVNGQAVWKPGKTKTVHTWLPIHGWTVEEVWDRIRASGVPHHWAYDVGMPRLSCCFCIFAPRAALLLAGKYNRALLREYVELEKEVGFTFKADLSLAEIEAALEAGEEPGRVQNWTM